MHLTQFSNRLSGVWGRTSSVLAVLTAGGWWWVSWLERTAREFIEHLAAD